MSDEKPVWADFDPNDDPLDFEDPFKRRTPTNQDDKDESDHTQHKLRFSTRPSDGKKTPPRASVSFLGVPESKSFDSGISKDTSNNDLPPKRLPVTASSSDFDGVLRGSNNDWKSTTQIASIKSRNNLPASWRIPDSFILQGHLSRRKGLRRKWTRELFAVQHNVLLICPKETPFLIGICIPLISIQKVEAYKDDLLLTITYLAPQRKGAAVVTVLICRAENRGERDYWVRELGTLQRAAIAKNKPIGSFVDRDAVESTLQSAFANWRATTTNALALTSGRLVEFKQREMMLHALIHWRDTIQKENLKVAKAKAANVDHEIASKSAAYETKLAAAQQKAQKDRRIMIACDRLRLYEKHLKHFSLIRLKRQADASVTENLATGAASLMTYTWRQHAELLARGTVDFRRAKISAVFNSLVKRRLRDALDILLLLSNVQRHRREQRALNLMQLLSYKENTMLAAKRRIFDAFRNNTANWQRRSLALQEILTWRRRRQIGGAVRRWYYFCVKRSAGDTTALEKLSILTKVLYNKSLSHAFRAIAKNADDECNLQSLQVAANLSLVNSKLLESFDIVPRHRGCGMIISVLTGSRRRHLNDAFHSLHFNSIRKRLYCKAVALLAAILHGGQQRRMMAEPFRIWLDGSRVASVWWQSRRVAETNRMRGLNLLVSVFRCVLIKTEYFALHSLRRVALIRSAMLDKERYISDCAKERDKLIAVSAEKTQALEARLQQETQTMEARLQQETQTIRETSERDKETLINKLQQEKEQFQNQTNEEKQAAIKETQTFLQVNKDAVAKGMFSVAQEFAEKIAFWYQCCRLRKMAIAFRQLQLATMASDVLRSIARLHMTQRLATILDRQRVVALTIAWHKFKDALLTSPRRHEHKMMAAVEALNRAKSMAQEIETRRMQDQAHMSLSSTPRIFTTAELSAPHGPRRKINQKVHRAARCYKRRKPRLAGRKLLARGLCLPSMKFRSIIRNRQLRPITLKPSPTIESSYHDDYSDSVERALKEADNFLNSDLQSELDELPVSHRPQTPKEALITPARPPSSPHTMGADEIMAACEEFSRSELLETTLTGKVFMESPSFTITPRPQSTLETIGCVSPRATEFELISNSSDFDLRELNAVLEDFADVQNDTSSTGDFSSHQTAINKQETETSLYDNLQAFRDIDDLQDFLNSTDDSSPQSQLQYIPSYPARREFEMKGRRKTSRKNQTKKDTKKLLAELEVVALGGVTYTDSSSKLSSRSVEEVVRMLESRGYKVAAPEPLQEALLSNSVGKGGHTDMHGHGHTDMHGHGHTDMHGLSVHLHGGVATVVSEPSEIQPPIRRKKTSPWVRMTLGNANKYYS